MSTRRQKANLPPARHRGISWRCHHCTIVSNLAASGLIPARIGGGIANFATGIPTGARVSIGDIGAYEVILPQLSIARSGPDVVLAWTAYAPGFTLYSNTSLTSPGSWASVPGVPAIVGSQYNQPLPATPGTVFFRLRSP